MDIGIYGRDKYYFNYRSDAFRALIEQVVAEVATIGQSDLPMAAE